jgi:hypothetical protein
MRNDSRDIVILSSAAAELVYENNWLRMSMIT